MKNIILIILIAVLNVFAEFTTDVEPWRLAKAERQNRLAKQAMRANLDLSENQTQFDVNFYFLDLELNFEWQEIAGAVTVEATALEPIDRIELDLAGQLNVDSVTVAGKPVSFTHENNRLSIFFETEKAVGELAKATIYYGGTPPSSGFGSFSFTSRGGEPLAWTLSEPFGARDWWPCKDAPIDKADSVDIRIRVPAGLIVASNGLLKEKIQDATHVTYHWQERYPITTYLVSLAVYPYHTYRDWYVNAEQDSMPVDFFVFPDHYPSLQYNYAKTVDMLAAFEDLFGPYPFFNEKYGHAEFGWGGGMEHQTITSLGGWSEGLIAHELAHQWWGDMITCESFHHIWLNEAFATYSEALWLEYSRGTVDMHSDMARKEYLGEGTVYVENPLTDNIFDYALTYAKSAWVLHMLRHVVGDHVFWDILDTYYQEFEHSTAATKDFVEVCERVSGRDLQTFFDQWIYKSGSPIYTYTWHTVDQEGHWRLKGTVSQNQPDLTFEMPIDVHVKFADGDTTLVFENSKHEENFEFVLNDKPESVELDPDNWVLGTFEHIRTPIFELFDVVLNRNDSLVHTLQPGKAHQIRPVLFNSGARLTGATLKFSTPNPGILIEPAEINLTAAASGDTLTDLPPVELMVPTSVSNGLLPLTMTVSGDLFEQELTQRLPVGQPNVLFVDDDNGALYEHYYEMMADKALLFAKVWDRQSRGLPDTETLHAYAAVVWFTGDDRESSLTSEEQALISDYMHAGGRLLITGQGIAEDLSTGSQADQLFLKTVLRAEYVATLEAPKAVVGLPQSAMASGLAGRFVDQYSSAENQDAPTEIAAVSPAEATFMYFPSQKIAGIATEDSGNNSKLVFLGFGLEGISGPKNDSSAQFLDQLFAWLSSGVHAGIDSSDSTPLTFQLLGNYPNPFNPRTRIEFNTPDVGKATLLIINALGQQVRRMDFETIRGRNIIFWDGRDHSGKNIAGGVYIATIRFQGEHRRIKMIKMP